MDPRAIYRVVSRGSCGSQKSRNLRNPLSPSVHRPRLGIPKNKKSKPCSPKNATVEIWGTTKGEFFQKKESAQPERGHDTAHGTNPKNPNKLNDIFFSKYRVGQTSLPIAFVKESLRLVTLSLSTTIVCFSYYCVFVGSQPRKTTTPPHLFFAGCKWIDPKRCARRPPCD